MAQPAEVRRSPAPSVGGFVILVGMVRKIAVTLDEGTVADLDRWVREGKYRNRSRALQSAADLLAERDRGSRLTRELAKIDPTEEKALAEEGLGAESWPAY